MLNFIDMLVQMVSGFLTYIYTALIETFSFAIADMMGLAVAVMSLPFVKNAVSYSQQLALAILAAKVMSEGIQTYILRQNGDPDSDPTGLIIRTAQSVAVISCLPWIVEQIFIFGTKVMSDVSNLGYGEVELSGLGELIGGYIANELMLGIVCIVIVVSFLVIGIQIGIRGAELAVMSILGSIIALNLTSNNRSLWSSWFKQIVIISVSPAIQLFMINGAIVLLTIEGFGSLHVLLVFGWLWATIKTPAFVKQFAYSNGVGGAIGGTAKQAGSMALMRAMMKG
jgi:hypothetical protein